MGFFSKFATALAGGAVGFLTGGPLGGIAGATGALAAPTLTGARTRVGGAQQRGIALAGETFLQTTQRKIAAGTEPLALAAAARRAALVTGQVRLKNMVQTVVQTIAPDGTVIREVVLEGRPFLMRKDFVILKRTLKMIAIADKRVPRARRRGLKERDELNELQGLVKGLIAGGDRTAARLINIDND